MLKSFRFLRPGVVNHFLFIFFFKNIDIIKNNRTSEKTNQNSQPYSGGGGGVSGYIQGLQVWSTSMTAQMFLVFEIWRFLSYVFFKKLKNQENLKFSNV